MVEIREILYKKNTEYLESCIYDNGFSEYKRDIAYELIRRFSNGNKHITEKIIFDCMDCLSFNEVIDLFGNENAYVAYIANRNISNRLMSTKNRNYFDDGRIRVRKKVKIKRKRVFKYED